MLFSPKQIDNLQLLEENSAQVPDGLPGGVDAQLPVQVPTAGNTSVTTEQVQVHVLIC